MRTRSPTGPPQSASRSWLTRLVGADGRGDRRYLVYLILIALAGWALASYDFNLLVTALPVIAASLHLSQTQVGLLAFLVYAAMLVLSLAAGYSMDRFGRKVMWQFALVGAAVFTGRQPAAGRAQGAEHAPEFVREDQFFPNEACPPHGDSRNGGREP